MTPTTGKVLLVADDLRGRNRNPVVAPRDVRQQTPHPIFFTISPVYGSVPLHVYFGVIPGRHRVTG
jgi:hypothetical protein